MSTDPAELSGDVARLRNAVSCELYAQLALRGERIEQEDVPEVAYAVAVHLRQAFQIQWAPRWAADDRDDDTTLGLDAAVFRASDGSADRYPIFDHGWPAR